MLAVAVFPFSWLVNLLVCLSSASIFRQNEKHEQIEIMANHGPFCKRIKMIKKTSSNQSCGRDREYKMVRFKVPQYILDQFDYSR